MIRLSNIEKSYRHGVSQTYVLRRMSADIAQGDFVSIMGPSGAGKITLLHILGMHDSRLDRRVLAARPAGARAVDKDRLRLQKKHIGFVFQSYHLLDNLTVYENLDLPLSYRDVKRTERQGMVGDILDRFDIVGKKDLYPNQLSGGQQQLVGGGAGGGRESVADPGRRADRQPALGPGPRDHGALRQAQRAGHDHRPGDPLGSQRRLRPPDHPSEGRLDCRCGLTSRRAC